MRARNSRDTRSAVSTLRRWPQRIGARHQFLDAVRPGGGDRAVRIPPQHMINRRIPIPIANRSAFREVLTCCFTARHLCPFLETLLKLISRKSHVDLPRNGHGLRFCWPVTTCVPVAASAFTFALLSMRPLTRSSRGRGGSAALQALSLLPGRPEVAGNLTG